MSRNPTAAKGARRHAPLEDDLVATGHLSTKAPKRKAGKGDEDSEDKFVDAKASRKILKIGQELADEEEERAQASRITTSTTNAAFNFESRFDDDEPDLRGETYDDDGEEAWGDADEEVVEEVDLAPEDLDTFKKFFPAGDEDPLLRTGGIWGKEGEDQEDEGPGTNLADLILEKIAAHEAQQAAQGKNVRFEGVGFGESAQREEDEFQMPPKVVEVYSK
jgi:essential nuclear protein 1